MYYLQLTVNSGLVKILSAAKKCKFVLRDSSKLTYTYLKIKSVNRSIRVPTNEMYQERYHFGEFHHLLREMRRNPDILRTMPGCKLRLLTLL